MSAKVINIESKPNFISLSMTNTKYSFNFFLKHSQRIIQRNGTSKEISYYIDDYIIPYFVVLCETLIFCNPTHSTIALYVRINYATFYNSGVRLEVSSKNMTEENRRGYFLARVPELAHGGQNIFYAMKYAVLNCFLCIFMQFIFIILCLLLGGCQTVSSRQCKEAQDLGLLLEGKKEFNCQQWRSLPCLCMAKQQNA